jgi:hypothetical protein
MYKSSFLQKQHSHDMSFPANMQTDRSAVIISRTRIILFDKTHINTTDLDSYEKIDGTVPCGSV